MRIKIGDLPQSLVDEIFNIWDEHDYIDNTPPNNNSVADFEFGKVIVKIFKKQHIDIKYHVVSSIQYEHDEIELSESALTFLKLKYHD